MYAVHQDSGRVIGGPIKEMASASLKSFEEAATLAEDLWAKGFQVKQFGATHSNLREFKVWVGPPPKAAK